MRPTAWDVTGLAVAILGMAIIMFAPRALEQSTSASRPMPKSSTQLTETDVQAYPMPNMKPLRSLLALVLVVLFVGLSFNAYACLVPIYVTERTMGSDCPSSQEEPARQFCDTFKSSAVQSSAESQPALDCQTFCSEDTASLSFLIGLHARHALSYDHAGVRPSQDLLLKTAVLRI